ncbi:MAG: iron-containing redox enzyme family protein, partial [Cytophagaceae bacterium]
ELGNGSAAQNHVTLYQQLLSKEGVPLATNLDDEYYHQGAIQLALGLLGQEFLPEVIGFNLGYEQLPLHLLITTYELDELGIDPYYFSLHVTVDNAHNGHAQQAVEAVFAMLPLFQGRDEFYQRIRQGYLLNNLGLSTEQIIERIDLKQAITNVFRQKAVMFGVFSRAEQQIIYDWIAGDWLNSSDAPRIRRYRAAHRHVTDIAPTQALTLQQALSSRNADLAHLAQKLAERDSSEQAFYLLMPYLAPALHTSPAGLWATQQFVNLLNQEAILPIQS